MAYQLLGKITGLGPTTVNAFLSIDEDRPSEFMITVLPSADPPFAIIAVPDNLNENPSRLTVRNLLRLQANGGLIYPPLEPKELEVINSSEFSLNKFEDGSYSGTWKFADKAGILHFLPPVRESVLKAEVLSSWAEFKQWASRAHSELNISIFRGHGSNKFQLSTTLHRAGRTRMDRYPDILSRFHAEAEAELDMRLDMNDGLDYSIVLGLAQHYGLPTPLLDWTYSPYVAAFFAFSDALDAAYRKNESHARIYGLSRDFLDISTPPNVVLTWPHLFVYSLAISSRHNARLRAQQGHFLATNIANVESWICNLESSSSKRFLYAVDVPLNCAIEALQDLAFMGLTAATMFPGLDGICRTLKHKMRFTTPFIKEPGLPASGQRTNGPALSDEENSLE